MAGAQRTATAVWEGNLTEGQGRVKPASGAFPEVRVTWEARTGGDDRTTSPEELIAAAHAACFSMALSNGLAKAGHAPERLEVTATCSFDPKPEGGFRIGSMKINVHGKVPGVDEAGFRDAARAAGEGCPVSGALKGNVEVSVEAALD